MTSNKRGLIVGGAFVLFVIGRMASTSATIDRSNAQAQQYLDSPEGVATTACFAQWQGAHPGVVGPIPTSDWPIFDSCMRSRVPGWTR